MGGYMDTLLKTFIAAVAALTFGGCASKGFNRGALQEQIGIKNPVVTDKDIKEILNKKANLPRPFKLAVYFKKPVEGYYQKSNWRWNDKDKELILEAANELKSEKLVSEVFPILGSVVEGNDLKSVRVAAAKHGADAVLVINGAGEIDKYTNKLGLSYILLVTAAFVPGSVADTLFMSSATMWDVRNEFLYLTAEAEGKVSETYIALFGETDMERIEKAKALSLANLKVEIVKMVQGMKK
jgi:hypothetical protein